MDRSRRAVLSVLTMLIIGTALFTSPARAAGFGRAGVVVVHGNGQVETRCVALTSAEINGLRLLKQSGLQFTTARFDFGRAVCWLDGEGVQTTDPQSCFSDPDENFWGYWTRDKGQSSPTESEVGAGDRTVTRGSIDYWKWDTFPQDAPPTFKLRDICGG